MTTTPDIAPANGRAGRKRFVVLIVFIFIVGIGVLQYVRGLGRVSTDDAFVDGRIYQITPRVDGYILQDLVEDNQLVEEGQPLLVLDPVGYEVGVAQARADLATAEAQLESLRKGVPLQKPDRISGHGRAGPARQLDAQPGSGSPGRGRGQTDGAAGRGGAQECGAWFQPSFRIAPGWGRCRIRFGRSPLRAGQRPRKDCRRPRQGGCGGAQSGLAA